jgi:lipopolysaccharide export LptBFGC system permease protein LptF
MMLMWALAVAVIYFGSFLAIGIIARIALRKLMERSGADLADVQAQAGPNRRKRSVFLLGAWREEG